MRWLGSVFLSPKHSIQYVLIHLQFSTGSNRLDWQSDSHNWYCVYVCSTTSEQRACEEVCVEPEATTGGDYSGDTLLASDEGTQQYVHKKTNALWHTTYIHTGDGSEFQRTSEPVLLYIL